MLKPPTGTLFDSVRDYMRTMMGPRYMSDFSWRMRIFHATKPCDKAVRKDGWMRARAAEMLCLHTNRMLMPRHVK